MAIIQDKLIGNADKPRISDPKIDEQLENLEEVSYLAVGASKMIVDIWKRLGKPNSPFTESGEKMVNVIIATWEELYPQDARDWYNTRAEYKKEELSITEQVHKKTGRSLASYPYPIFQMLKKVFPAVKLGERDVCKKFVRKWPMFRMANKI